VGTSFPARVEDAPANSRPIARSGGLATRTGVGACQRCACVSRHTQQFLERRSWHRAW
jgi:hypothetical protein